MRMPRKCMAVSAALGAIVSLVAGSAFAQESSATSLMAKANERFERGEYAEAAQQYEALVDQGYSDAALYLNLGNAYFESGDMGRAILMYLRAQELSPRESDVRDNLELAHTMAVDHIAAERDTLVESVSHFVRLWVTPGELGAAALLLWMLTGAAICALVIRRAFPLRRVLRAMTAVAIAATVMSFLLLVTTIYADPYANTGVVTAAAVEVLSGPGPQYAGEFSLHSGAQVRVTDSRHGWIRIELPGGELQGWVPSHAVEIVGGDI